MTNKIRNRDEGLFPEDAFRHAMWEHPSGEGLTDGIFALRVAIWKALVPLDGRPNYEVLVEWLAEVYDESAHHRARDLVWLIGDIAWRRWLFVMRLTEMAEKEKRPDRRAMLVSQREAMKRINEALMEAIIKSA